MAPWEEGTEGERFSEDTSRRASRLAEKKAEAFLFNKGNRDVIQSSTCTTRARTHTLNERAVSLAQQP